MGRVFGQGLDALDRFQQRHAAWGFPIAVWRKFSDDQAGNLAALIAYYAFVSVFPLLLILVTVLGLVLENNPGLQRDVLDSALTEFPVIGPQVRENIHAFGRGGWGLAAGLIGIFLGARGLAGAVQNAMNQVWAVPRRERPGFPVNLLRGLALIGVLGLGVIVTTALSGIGAWGGNTFGGAIRVGVVAASLVLNVGLFWLGLRVATAAQITWRQLLFGAALSALVWQALQYLGGYVVAHTLRHASSLYGTFGLVLGLLGWFYLQAQLTLYAAEIDVVRTRRLWPRSLFPPPLTKQDRAAYRSYAQAEQRRPEIRIETHFTDPQRQRPDGADRAGAAGGVRRAEAGEGTESGDRVEGGGRADGCGATVSDAPAPAGPPPEHSAHEH